MIQKDKHFLISIYTPAPLEHFVFMHSTPKCDCRTWIQCSQYISAAVYNIVLVIHFSCQLHE